MAEDRAPGAGDRERRIAATFVGLADTLVRDFDITDLMTLLVRSCVDVLGSAAAGLMLVDRRGGLQVLAASTETTRVLELFELQHDQGPCLECFRSGRPVLATPLDEDSSRRWPLFVERAREVGFDSVQALPLRLRDTTLGALNLFGNADHTLAVDDVPIAQALADVATIALVQYRTVQDGELVAEQLQAALTDRLVIEQAKGLLAERAGLDIPAAFELLRDFSRRHRLAVATVARELLEHRRDADDVLASRWPNDPADL